MRRRTTIEIDDELLARAKRVLHATTTRAAVEQALQHASEAAESQHDARAEGQRRYLATLGRRIDADVLRSDDMWR
jgi:Arc/MetJ family transcription regulator